MILISYDGSADARAAVEQAARLFPDEAATVLTAWEPFVEVIARTTVGFGLVPNVPDSREIDEASQKSAEQTASEGVELAAQRGMGAHARSRAQETTTALAILAEADELEADAIVMGSRGLTGGQAAAAWQRFARGDSARRPHGGRGSLARGGHFPGARSRIRAELPDPTPRASISWALFPRTSADASERRRVVSPQSSTAAAALWETARALITAADGPVKVS